MINSRLLQQLPQLSFCTSPDTSPHAQPHTQSHTQSHTHLHTQSRAKHALKKKLKWGWVCADINIDANVTTDNDGNIPSQVYYTKKYTLHEIYHEFSNVKTLDDLECALYNIALLMDSPSGSYFFVDKSTGIFYHDKCDKIMWKFDKATGYVCTTAEIYVAKSLPEFLSHVLYDSNMCKDMIKKKI